jgi:hypothetical protein
VTAANHTILTPTSHSATRMDAPVLLTGYMGQVGQAILSRHALEYDWRLLDREPPVEDQPGEVFIADVTEDATVREAVAGCGAVVHLAGDPRPSAPWDSVLSNNVDGTHTVLQAAVEEGVEKVAFASSNHAVGYYESDERTPGLYRPDGDFQLDGTATAHTSFGAASRPTTTTRSSTAFPTTSASTTRWSAPARCWGTSRGTTRRTTRADRGAPTRGSFTPALERGEGWSSPPTRSASTSPRATSTGSSWTWSTSSSRSASSTPS